MPTEHSRPLAGIRVVEVSSFVASPLCGLTLSQLGAEVIRVDPIGGARDVNRWPLTDDGTTSIYWTGLNKGKKSVTADLRSAEGQRLVQRLVTESGPGGGILVTNSGGREWMSTTPLPAPPRRHPPGAARRFRRLPRRRLHRQCGAGISTDHRPRRP